MWKRIKAWFQPDESTELQHIQKLGEIRAHLYELETTGIETVRCSIALKFFSSLEEHRTDLHSLIPEKLAPGELLRDRLTGTVDKTFSSGMSRLQRVARLIDRVPKVAEAERKQLLTMIDEALAETTADVDGLSRLWQQLIEQGADQRSTAQEVDHLVEILRRTGRS